MCQNLNVFNHFYSFRAQSQRHPKLVLRCLRFFLFSGWPQAPDCREAGHSEGYWCRASGPPPLKSSPIINLSFPDRLQRRAGLLKTTPRSAPRQSGAQGQPENRENRKNRKKVEDAFDFGP